MLASRGDDGDDMSTCGSNWPRIETGACVLVYSSINTRAVITRMRVQVGAHFVLGVLVGASLLDRLWLLGGISAAWWASGAVGRNSRGGAFARRVGAEVGAKLRDLQEKYRQAVIFYRTGERERAHHATAYLPATQQPSNLASRL